MSTYIDLWLIVGGFVVCQVAMLVIALSVGGRHSFAHAATTTNATLILAEELRGLREDARLARVHLAPDELRQLALTYKSLERQLRALAETCGLESVSPARDLRAIGGYVVSLQHAAKKAATSDSRVVRFDEAETEPAPGESSGKLAVAQKPGGAS